MEYAFTIGSILKKLLLEGNFVKLIVTLTGIPVGFNCIRYSSVNRKADPASKIFLYTKKETF